MSATQTARLNFSSIKNIPAYPDLLDIQIKSFQDFFQLETKSEERGNEGLYSFKIILYRRRTRRF